MDIENALRHIHSLSDLPRLVTAVGHQPLWEPVPDEAWNRKGTRPLAVVALGRSSGVPWFGIESHAPDRDARILARRITARGRLGVVLALEPNRRRLAVAAAFGRCPVLGLQLPDPEPEAVTTLARLCGAPEGGPLAYAAHAAEALSSEPVGQRFFRAFRTSLTRMTERLPGPLPPPDRQALILLQLTRVLFLYFIQAKGWLDGRDQFLAQELDRCLSQRRKVHRHLLRPLFFGTLNQPFDQRSARVRRFGSIPFLNGGLFEPHPLERRCKCDISNELWEEAFTDLFERFHFTVSEGKLPGCIAPDMLGQVFEGVMEPEARRTSGTFYTPAALVSRVLDAALTALLSRQLGCTEGQAARLLGNRDARVIQVLRSITILDPAAGSGAFLLGALERLAGLSGSHERSALTRRRVLERNLFGVDRNPAAVRLTELRLWLAVIANDTAGNASQVQPLPNLDCLIRQGDTLFQPPGLELGKAGGPAAGALVKEISLLRHRVVAAAGPAKNLLVRQLRAIEMQMVGVSIAAAEERHLNAVRECLEQARALDLFGRRRGLDAHLQGRLERLRRGLRDLRRAQRGLTGHGEVPWFHYESHFADVFARGGFDLVVGNPPWLRSESLAPSMRPRLAERYRWWRGKGRSYGNSPDLAVAFLERAFELARPGGTVAMLVPAKIVTTGCSAAARHALTTVTTLHVVADLTAAPEATFDATVYPLALVASKGGPATGHRVRTALDVDGPSVRQSQLCGSPGGPWILTPRLTGLLTPLRAHPVWADSVTCHLGVKTGLNRVFLNPPAELEPELVRYAVRGRDVSAFRCRSRATLLWAHDTQGRPVSNLPPKARAYLDQFDAALRGRRDFRGGPPWALFRTRPATARYRVVWADVARQLTAVALVTRRDRRLIPLNSCYLAPVRSCSRAHALCCWLNSTWIKAIARVTAVPAAGGFARFNAQTVEQLPLPPATLVDPELARIGRAARSGASVQADLDRLVAQHLRLSTSAQRALRTALDSADHRR